MSSLYPIVRFTAAPNLNAPVRFDFHAAGSYADDEALVDRDGFSLGTPTLEGDPAGIGTTYGLRTLTVPLLVSGSSAAASKALRTLAREITQRPSNWLLFQLTADHAPVWFRTFRSDPPEIDFEHVYVEGESLCGASRWSWSPSHTPTGNGSRTARSR